MPVLNFKEWLTNLLTENFKTQREKFIKQGFQPAIVDSYINDFKVIREKKYGELSNEIIGVTVPKEKRNDIDAYPDFHQLEIVVDYIKGQRELQPKPQNEKIDAKPIYQKDGIEIYHGDSSEACIKIKGNHPYTWCVARNDASNMYNNYRYNHNEPSFYFVKNTEKSNEDPYHFFVIQITKNDKYIVTSKKNDGDQSMSWEQIIKIEPKLNGLQNLFKQTPLNPEEKAVYKRFKEGINDTEFRHLTYKEKIKYVDIYRSLTDFQFYDAPEDLKNKYINLGVGLTNNQYKIIKDNKKLKERYIEIISQKVAMGNHNLNDNENIIYNEFTKELFDKAITEKTLTQKEEGQMFASKEFPYFVMKKIEETKKIPIPFLEKSIEKIFPKDPPIDDYPILQGKILYLDCFNNDLVETRTDYPMRMLINETLKKHNRSELRSILSSKVPLAEREKEEEEQYDKRSGDKFLRDDCLWIIFAKALKDKYLPILIEKVCNVEDENGMFLELAKNNTDECKLTLAIEIKNFASLYVKIHDNFSDYHDDPEIWFAGHDKQGIVISEMKIHVIIRAFQKPIEISMDINSLNEEELLKAWRSEFLNKLLKIQHSPAFANKT